MKTLSTCLLIAISVLGLASLAAAQQGPRLNEIVRNDVSTDDHEFVEICAEPNTNLAGYWIVEIEGEAAGKGLIDKAIALTGTVGASGLYTIGMPLVTCADQSDPLTIENGGVTILLVQGFTGAVGTDLDTNDDCVADVPFPGTIVDGVGMGMPSAGDCYTYYGVPGLGPDTGPGGTSDFDPAGVARCLDCTGTWGMICLDGTEGALVCFASNPQGLYSVDGASPCARNLCGAVPVENTTWGAIKNTYK